MIQPTHLANPHSYTRNECRTPWDNDKFPDKPDPLTTDLDEVTCLACRQALIKRGVCPNCGERRLVWSAMSWNKSNVVEGRLTTNDVETSFYLGCEECSETLIPQVDPETVAKYLNAQGWTP